MVTSCYTLLVELASWDSEPNRYMVAKVEYLFVPLITENREGDQRDVLEKVETCVCRQRSVLKL